MFLNVDSLTLGWLVTGKVEIFVPRAAQTAVAAAHRAAVVPRAAQTAVAAVHRAAVVPRAAQTAVVPRAAQTAVAAAHRAAVVHTVVGVRKVGAAHIVVVLIRTVVQHGWRIAVD